MECVKSLYNDAPWEFDCICGPDAMGDGLWACFRDGTVTDDPPGDDGRYYVVCRRCGKIIDTKSLEVVGQRDVDGIDEEIDNL